MIGETELENRFGYHSPDELRAARHGKIRGALLATAAIIDVDVPDGREKSLAVTHLEEAMFWANAGIAREPK